ncbi:MAG: HAMP domain-containing protein [candidate division NC10 bacterium]|nr:HAMP domain-containing protein [candidate division NC10 bacterium]
MRPEQKGRRLGLRLKFFVLTNLLLATLIISGALLVEWSQRGAIIAEMQKRALSIARGLAAVSTSDLLTYNYVSMEQNVNKVAQEADVVYAIIMEMDGAVAAHSRQGEQVGKILKDDASIKAREAEKAFIEQYRLSGTGEMVYEAVVPVYIPNASEKWGTVRVGISPQRMYGEIARTRRSILLFGLMAMALGSLGSILVARRITGPLQRLVQGALAVSRGDLDQKIPVSTADEIQELAETFNHMTAQLFQKRNELQAANLEVARSFKEIFILKSYTDNILKSMTSGVITVDLEGRIVTLNEAASRILGHPAEKVTGKTFDEIHSLRPPCKLAEILLNTLNQEKSYTFPEVEFMKDNGVRIPLGVTTSVLIDDKGQKIGALALFNDLTEVKHLEEQLRRSDRLASLGTIAAGIAHDIRNPLTSISIFSQLISHSYEDPEIRSRFEKVVPRELDRIQGITDDLLELARPVTLSFEPTNVHDTLSQILEILEEQISKQKIKAFLDLEPQIPLILADKKRLHRGLMNIVHNAVQAMSNGGELRIRTHYSPPMVISNLPTQDGRGVEIQSWLQIMISDTGVGIPPDVQRRLFDPFFTTKEKGTGLGMAITHKIIEDHRGTIDLRSQVGQGTTFTIRLPVSPTSPA